jgi:3',5'-cyclic AMP phosphodiesterase CpdA
MKTIVHISDLHFGRTSASVAEALLMDIKRLGPTVVVVSGDLTQRARRHQFAAAREYLNLIPYPLVIIPGNHDIPLYHVINRLLRPFHGYRRHISRDFSPLFADDRLVVLGINTVCPYRWTEGHLSRRQMETICSTFARFDPSSFKVLVTHHPFVLPERHAKNSILARSDEVMQTIRVCGADLLLSGHLHVSCTAGLPVRFSASQREPVLAVQAGTAISTRRREEPNAYNIITIQSGEVLVKIRKWAGEGFATFSRTRFVRESKGWEMRDAF